MIFASKSVRDEEAAGSNPVTSMLILQGFPVSGSPYFLSKITSGLTFGLTPGLTLCFKYPKTLHFIGISGLIISFIIIIPS